MLAADAKFDFFPLFAAKLAGNPHQLAHAIGINTGKGVLLHDVHFLINREETARVITAHCQGCLGQVVRTKAKELGVFCNFVGGEGCARHLDHGADKITEFHLLFLGYGRSDAMNQIRLEFELTGEARQRNHHLGTYLDTLFLDFGGGFEDGTSLHFGDFGEADAETATAVAQHGIELVQVIDPLGNLLSANS